MDAKKKLADSMEKLLQKKSLEEITILDIVEDCDICRTTFYRHFKDKYDLVSYIYFQENKVIREKFEKTKNLCDGIREYLEFLYEKRLLSERAFEYVGQNSPMDSIYECGISAMYDKILPMYDGKIPEEIDNSIRFYVCGMTYMTKRWISGGFRESPEEMSKIAFDNMPQNLKEILKNSK